jgi:uncharacterized protein YutE (UPF0331/DUF86 family)
LKTYIDKLTEFLNETIEYFLKKAEGVDRDRYFADRDIRYILDKCINDIILCMVDIAEACLKHKNRSIPDTYRDTILACYEFVGETALKVAPLVKHRNELVHQYLKVNWHNIVIVKSKIEEIVLFAESIKRECHD